MSKSKSIAIYISIAFAVVGAAVGGYFIFRKNHSKEACVVEIKDSYEPTLEITFASSESDSKLSEFQVKELERGILEIYNDASGGCSGEYKRWMYGINMIDQTVVNHPVMEAEAESSISHKIDDEYSLVVRLGTMISCDGCVDDEAFASVYPARFGSIRPITRHLEQGLSTSTIFSRLKSFADTNVSRKESIKQMSLISSTAKHSSYYDETLSRSEGTLGGKGDKAGGRSVGDKGTKGPKGFGRIDDNFGVKGTKGPKGVGRDFGVDGTKGTKGTKAMIPIRNNCSNGKSKGFKGTGGENCTPVGTDERIADSSQTDPPRQVAYTPQPTKRPTPEPTAPPTPNPTPEPTPQPTLDPTPEPTPPTTEAAAFIRDFPPPTPQPIRFAYTPQPTKRPTPEPTAPPTPNPTPDPTPQPTPDPTPEPTPERTTPRIPFPSSPPPPFGFDRAEVTCTDDPCMENFTAAGSCDPLVEKLVEVDSWCGVLWDPWCVVAYNDCFETTACNASRIDGFVVENNINRTSEIVCPANETTVAIKDVEPISQPLVENPSCPAEFPGNGSSCEAIGLQCTYFSQEDGARWMCNCANEFEFGCKPAPINA